MRYENKTNGGNTLVTPFRSSAHSVIQRTTSHLATHGAIYGRVSWAARGRRGGGQMMQGGGGRASSTGQAIFVLILALRTYRCTQCFLSSLSYYYAFPRIWGRRGSAGGGGSCYVKHVWLINEDCFIRLSIQRRPHGTFGGGGRLFISRWTHLCMS